MIFLTNKIDLLYVFNFEPSDIEGAIARLRCSIKSISFQNVQICICNNSTLCIYDKISDIISDVKYIHSPYRGKFSKALGINYGVKKLINTEYFMLSDVDLVYSRDHIQRLVLKCTSLIRESEKIRFIFYNYNILPVTVIPRWRTFLRKVPFTKLVIKENARHLSHPYTQEYEVLDRMVKEPGGYAHGNGLIHTESFYQIRGYDEDMIGYGPEDDLFNIRISKINRIIYDNLPDTASFHLWHPKQNWIQVEKNLNIWREKKVFYNSLNNPTYLDVMANKDQAVWGVI